MATVTNIVAASALRGEGVVVTLGSSDTINTLPTLTKNQKCTNGNSKVGYINFIDPLGRTFIVMPANPDQQFDSSATPGVLSASESITIV
jgi:hypothetical protein